MNTNSGPKVVATVERLREQISARRYEPGDKLPRRVELARSFGVSGVTIQHAMNQLMAEGHLEATPSKGTFVVESPPSLFRYGILLPAEEMPAQFHRALQWSNFWTAICSAAQTKSDPAGVRFEIYHGISDHTDTAGYAQLIADVAAHRLAGLLLLSSRYRLRKVGLDRQAIPVVSLIGEEMCVTPDMASFFSGALDHLSERGRRRIAVLLPTGFGFEDGKLEALFAAKDLTLQPRHKQFLWPWSEPEAMRNAVDLLLSGAADERPDGLIIADDHLVPDCTVGIAATGLAVPRDLDVVAYATFPMPTQAHVPALRRGVCADRLLDAAVELACRIRETGANGRKQILLPAVNDDEVPQEDWRQYE